MNTATAHDLREQARNGVAVDPAVLAQAEQYEQAAAKINSLQAERQRELEQVRYVENRRAHLMERADDHFDQAKNAKADTTADEQKLAEAVRGYIEGVLIRNERTANNASAFADEKRNPTEGLNFPHPFESIDGNLTVKGVTQRQIDIPRSVERTVALVLGEFFPNHPAFLGFGGDVAATNRGLR